jgi:hypothetical protein
MNQWNLNLKNISNQSVNLERITFVLRDMELTHPKDRLKLDKAQIELQVSGN